MRNFINIVQEAVSQWPQTISGNDLADIIQNNDIHHTPEDWIDGDIDENITAYGQYTLQAINPASLRPELNIVHDDLVTDYASREGDAPPIVLDHRHYIIDGTHRTKAAQVRGDETIMAYVGDEATYSPPDDEDEWVPKKY